MRLSALAPLVIVATLVFCSPARDGQTIAEPEATGDSDAGAAVSGFAPRATGGFASVVIFEPLEPVEFSAPAEPAVLDQYNTDFHPRLLVVRRGQTVQFKNSEDTLHNVHVIDVDTRDTAFNVATPVEGSFDFVFDHEAVYDVSCGIHPSMAAFIVVSSSPYAAAADKDGRFSIGDVPPGRYRARVWNLDPSRRSERIVTVETEASDWRFDEVS